MRTRWLMTVTAAALCLSGVAALFLPQEMLVALDAAAGPVPVLILQLLGGAHFSLGMLAWLARGFALGGIYGRPVILTFLAYFLVATLTLGRMLARHAAPGLVLAFVASLALLLAFVVLFRSSPSREDPH